MSEKNNRFKGTVGTIAFHLLALLAILYFALSTPLPLPGEEGVEVNLGSSNVGMGQVQEQSPPPVQQPIPQPPPPQNDPEPEPEEDIITQDVEETPAIEEEEIEEKEEEIIQEDQTTKNEEQTPNNEPVEEVVEELEPEPEPPKVNQRALYKGNTDTDGDGSNQGETGQPGDQGKPDGTIDSRNYDGSGKGDQGIGYDLGGRGALSLQKPVYTSEEVGTVKVKVWVNRTGQVTKAVFEMKGSNNSSPALVDEAIKAALKSKFEADPNAPETQIGYITYNFIRIN
jgi:outer membrane biosynthesis protein TonB